MHAKIQDALTTQKSLKTSPHAQTARIHVYHIEYAPIADFIQGIQLSILNQNRSAEYNQVKRLPKIGIDLLGSDTPPEILLKDFFELLKELEPFSELTLFGTEALFKSFFFSKNVNYIVVTEVITHEDDPLVALRRKKDSSIYIGMRMLQRGELDAFVSAGNTGALLASAALFLPLLPSIERPALLTLLPTKLKEIAVLDVGANVSAKVEHLIQFALMGIAYQKSRGVEKPTVGLLNIGVEEKKGTPELREAYKRLQALLNSNQTENSATFIGNIEGRDVFKGHVDVLVTDGFTGNVFLKTAEGIAAFVLDQLEENAHNDRFPYFKNLLNTFRQRLHYAEYPGAILCGVEGIVVKCHGEFSSMALLNSVKGAIGLSEHSFLTKLKKQLGSLTTL